MTEVTVTNQFQVFGIAAARHRQGFPGSFKGALEQKGFRLNATEPGGHWLADIKAAMPDVILLDSQLPEACELCETLKNTPETAAIPVIFVDEEGTTSEEQLVAGFDSGACDFIHTNQDPAEVSARLQAAIRERQSTEQTQALTEQLTTMNAELYERNLQVEKELYTARQLQQSLLPPFIVDESPVEDSDGRPRLSKCHYKDERLRISGVYLPCDALGGDLYDVVKFPSGTIGVSIADVSGHGVPAGFVTAIYKSSFYRITHNHNTPDAILYHLNNELADIVKTGEYVTAVYGQIQETGNQLIFEYSGAGHPYPIHYGAAKKSPTRLQENGTPLVWVKGMEYPRGEITLQPGDRILMYTDGITEMRNTQGEFYGEDALEQAYMKLVETDPDRILDGLIDALSDYAQGHPLEDDLSMVLIEAL